LPYSVKAPFCFASGKKELHPTLPHSVKALFRFASGRRSSILLCLSQKELHSTSLLTEGTPFYFVAVRSSVLLWLRRTPFYFVSVRRGSILLWLRRISIIPSFRKSSILLCCCQKEPHYTLTFSQSRKRNGEAVAVYAIMAYRAAEVQLHLFLTFP
jgi:hypothetical protein